MNAPVSCYSQVNTFVSNHKILCLCTLGTAAVLYAVGVFLGRMITWIKEKLGLVARTDEVARRTIRTSTSTVPITASCSVSSSPLLNNAIAISEPPNVSTPRSILRKSVESGGERKQVAFYKAKGREFRRDDEPEKIGNEESWTLTEFRDE